MKRSRIICSIITVIYIIISVLLIAFLTRSNIVTKSNLDVNFKIIHVAVFFICVLMYIMVRRKLIKKTSNMMVINMYCYMFLAAIVFVSRLVLAYMLKENSISQVEASFANGLGSYINYALGRVVGNAMYANIILNTIITFVSCILIKKLILNIIQNDVLATLTSITYVFLPKSLLYVGEYTRYAYNVLVVLVAMYCLFKIIDEVKNFSLKNKKYLIHAVVLGVVQGIDILLGGSYIFWIVVMLFVTMGATYVDMTHIKFKEEFVQKLDYKKKIIISKIERINISKLIYVSLISLSLSGMAALVYGLVIDTNNYVFVNVIQNLNNNLIQSRTYYTVLIIFALVFEILSVILRRKIDIKMLIVKLAYIAASVITAFIANTTYASYLFDTMLVMFVVINICNICYNREDKVKLIKEKN